MIVASCPMAVAKAPIDVVWQALTDAEHLDSWADGQVTAVSPSGRAQAGQRIELAQRDLGIPLRAYIDVLEVDESAHRVRWDAHLPLIGVVNHQTTSLAATEEGTLISFG